MIPKEEIEEFMKKTAKFYCPVHGAVLIKLHKLWKTTLRCRFCYRVLNHNPDGTLDVFEDIPE